MPYDPLAPISPASEPGYGVPSVAYVGQTTVGEGGHGIPMAYLDGYQVTPGLDPYAQMAAAAQAEEEEQQVALLLLL